MNLVEQPFVPVLFQNGKHRLASLSELFAKADRIRDLSLPPPQRIAVTRLLLAVTHAALNGPEDQVGWNDCRDRIVPECLKYLETQKGSFELYGEAAFLQPSGLEATDNATLDKLDFGLASGNNDRLFDREAAPDGRDWPDSWRALNLLAFQCFSPGGTIGTSTWTGVATSKNSNHAPCVSSSMLHTHVRGANLLETIHWNLLTKQLVESNPGMKWGKPVWEQMPTGPEDTDLVNSYLGRLVPLSRGIRLKPYSTRITFVNGLGYPGLDECREPFATTRRKRDDTIAYLGIDLARHPWRELGSVLNLGEQSDGTSGPLMLQHLKEMGDVSVDIWAGGLVADKGKLIDVAEWVLNVPTRMLDSRHLQVYREGVEFAQRAEQKLADATNEYGSTLSEKKKPKQSELLRVSSAKNLFWSILDTRYETLLEAAKQLDQQGVNRWEEAVSKAQRSAYRQSCPKATPRQIGAFAAGRRKLFLRRSSRTTENKKQPIINEEQSR